MLHPVIHILKVCGCMPELLLPFEIADFLLMACCSLSKAKQLVQCSKLA